MAQCERIHSVGKVNPNGTRWKLSEAEIFACMQREKHSFYVERPFADSVAVIIATASWF
jgi:hypothetical protein